MKGCLYSDTLARLDSSLALESDLGERQKLTQCLTQEIDKLEAAQTKTITPRQVYSPTYWRARAARLREATDLYRSGAAHDHLVQVAIGYDSLAECAYRIQQA